MIPTEDIEAQKLATRLRFKNYTFTHFANESGQYGSKNIIIMMNKKKKMGVSKGVPDYMLILKRGSLLFLELKRQKKILKSGKIGASPSIVSEEQKVWVEKLNNIDNVGAFIAYGCDEAIKIIEEQENL